MNSSKTTKKGYYAGRTSHFAHLFVRAVYLIVDLVLLLPIVLISLISRLVPRAIEIGLGPLPTINSFHHKKCLERYGYRCETFVYHTWYFTQEFDVNLSRYCPRALGPYVSYIYCVFRYKCLYTYFNGGPLGFTTLLARCEPYLLKLAGIRTIILPFGADVHVLTRTSNRMMVHAFAKDYPNFRFERKRTAALVDVWTCGADHIISGCDWIDFLYHWDTLTLSHFAVDTESYGATESFGPPDEPCVPLRLLHAPNHRNLKGTDHILKAVEELRAEGVAVELSLVEGVPNSQMPALIQAADVVVDQLVLGWYAMFAIEAMALARPVVCSVRPDFLEFYQCAGLLQVDELPLVDSSMSKIKDTLRKLASMPRRDLHAIGHKSRQFVEKHHSISAVGAVFDRINRQIGIRPAAM